MRVLQFGVAATWAASAQAMLITPTIPREHDMDVELMIAGQAHVAVPCPDCSFQVTDLEGQHHAYTHPNKLLLDLVVPTESPNVLMLNEMQIWPVDILSGSEAGRLSMPQVAELMPSKWQLVGNAPLSYHLAYTVQKHGDTDLININLEITEVNGRPVHSVPTVSMEILQQASGLYINHAQLEPPAAPPAASPEPEDQHCADALCKLRQAVKHAMGRFRGCGGRHRHSGHGSHRHPHHSEARPGSYRHDYLRIMRAFAFHVLMPVSIGIMAGITASVLGMVVGHLIVIIYRILFRRRRADEDSDDKADQIMIVTADGLPVYEEVDTNEKQRLLEEVEEVVVVVVDEH